MAQKENTVTWLHLSDLHFCEPKTGWDSRQVMDNLVEDLKSMEDDHGLNPDLLFFTGDLAFGNYNKEKGGNLKDQYDGVDGFLKSVRNAFPIPIPKERVFLVPGNHDVDRKTVSRATTAYLDGLESAETVTDMIKEANQDWKDCIRRLDGFRQFLEAHGYKHLLTDPERLVYAAKQDINGVEVGIGGLNSAWSCSRASREERGKLWMGAKWQVTTVSSALKGSDITLALAHHSSNWLVEPEDKCLKTTLSEKFHFFLHGHEHQDWVVPKSENHVTMSAGACYRRSDKANGYSIVRLDFDRRVCEIWLREYSDRGEGGWIPHIIKGKTNNDGLWLLENLKFLQGLAPPPGPKPKPSPKPEPPPDDPAVIKLREDYLKRVMNDVGYLSLAGIDRRSAADDHSMRFELDSVYTALATRSGSGDMEKNLMKRMAGPEKEAMAGAVTMLNRHPRLVLLGEPGSGKSMFVNFAAWCMAGEMLEPRHESASLELLKSPLPSEKDDDDKKPQPWEHGPLIPVRVVLRDFVAKGLPSADEKATGNHLWQFIASYLAAHQLENYIEPLKKRLKEQGGLVLLDGLDEVPEAGKRRERIREVVEDFAVDFHRCRILVTSRTYAYQKQNWLLKNFEVAVLAPFTSAQVRFFADTWYRKVAPLRGIPLGAVEKRADMLKQAIGNNPRLCELAGRPLLLTLMACLHAWHSGSLPEKREDLYRETVDLLLNWWERAKWSTAENGAEKMDEPSLVEYLNTDREAIRKLLNQLSFEAHATQPDLAGTADISQDDLVSGLVKISNNPNVQPVQLIKYLSERAGILAQRAEGVFTFPHRTFQEYLAACHLTDDNFPEKIVELFKDDPERWREAVLLAGAKAARGAAFAVWELAEELCCDVCEPDAAMDCVWGAHLAGALLVESADLEHVGKRNLPKMERIRQWTVCIVTGDRLPALERAAAGVTLARLGDPREEIMTLDKMQFCLVPAGDFVMSENDNPKEICSHLQYPFWMGRFPVTNAQYQVFMDDGGYAEEKFWKEAVREKVWKDGKVQNWFNTEYRNHPQRFMGPFGLPNHPVVGVTWYEAMAFARWLDDHWQKRGLVPENWRVSLPTEAQWEKAARGGLKVPERPVVLAANEIARCDVSNVLIDNENAARKYPWGNEMVSEKMNIKETDIGATSTPGCFSDGKSPCGCEEMSGNVTEWTRSQYMNYPYQPDDGREESSKITKFTNISWRGGDFTDNPSSTRCGFRYDGDPYDHDQSVGFRILLSPPYL